MLEGLVQEINDFIEDENRDLKFKLKDIIYPLNFDSTPAISYDYLYLDGSEFSFNNLEINATTSEEFPDLSDAQIYFNKIKKICRSDFGELRDKVPFFQILTSPNKNVKKVADFIFSQKLQANQIPPFFEIKLYTNENGDKAPRIFGFIGNASFLYILFYDPFHKIYEATGKIT